MRGERRFKRLEDNLGTEPIAALDRDQVREIRDMPCFRDKPSVADAIVERIGTLWDFAGEHLRIPEMRKNRDRVNPARGIKKLKDDDAESAPLWALDLCQKFERYASPDLRTFYAASQLRGFFVRRIGSGFANGRRSNCKLAL